MEKTKTEIPCHSFSQNRKKSDVEEGETCLSFHPINFTQNNMRMEKGITNSTCAAYEATSLTTTGDMGASDALPTLTERLDLQ